MKYSIIILFVLVFACKNENKENDALVNEDKTTVVEENLTAYQSFGDKIDDKNVISTNELLKNYQSIKNSDTLNLKAKVKVLEVCQSKGCWMIVDLGQEKTARIKFKDYAFFMPKDISGKDVIINGKVFVNEMPVDELRHYAEDAGKTADEVAKITEPEITYSFLADGVLLANN